MSISAAVSVPEAPGPRELLVRAEELVDARRAAVVADLEVCLGWADLHGEAPAREVEGGARLIWLGGEGSPPVVDVCLGELSIARGVHVHATRAAIGDALDLRHRLPRLWQQVQALEVEAWVARKIAVLARPLSPEGAALVDAAVAAAVAHSPGRLLALAEAAVIEADQDGRRAELEAARALTGVWISSGRDDLAGLRTLCARLQAADAIWLDATIQRIADTLADDPALRAAHHPDLGPSPTAQQLRAAALAWLARPHDLATLLGLPDTPDDADERCQAEQPDRAEQRGRGRRRRARLGQEATVYVHLHESVLEGGSGVARCEELGPLLRDQLAGLLGHAHITLKPVIDLTYGRSVRAYEFPAAIRERAHLRTLGDVFPYATSSRRRLDGDHVQPYDPGGPPDQTADHNLAPLGRRHHRIKTHLAYRVQQVGPTTYQWTTPHGLVRWVDAMGTHRASSAIE